MGKSTFPAHIGFIPDGNRRWSSGRGLGKAGGYRHGVSPGVQLFETCKALGVEEISFYGFTKENSRRSREEIESFRAACVDYAAAVIARGCAFLALGDDRSPLFPDELKPYRSRIGEGMKVNLLVNYGWSWDIDGLREEGRLRSAPVSGLDLIVRWGGGRRLSGFLPVQSVYADFYVIDELWPDFRPEHLDQALSWFRRQDRTWGT